MISLIRICAILLITVLITPINAQTFNCEEYYNEYCSQLVNKKDQEFRVLDFNGKKAISHGCLNDLVAFCEGVEEALMREKLVIKSIGDPNLASQCLIYSYERFGVSLVFTGDIIDDQGIKDENAGFNFIMRKRILTELGEDVYNEMGVIDSTWLEIDEEQINEVFKDVKYVLLNDSTAFVSFNIENIEKSKYGHLRGVKLMDGRGRVDSENGDFYNGVQISLRGDREKKGYVRIVFADYDNPNFCQTRFKQIYTVPINVK